MEDSRKIRLKNAALCVLITMPIMSGLLLVKYLIIDSLELDGSFLLRLVGILAMYLFVLIFFAVLVWFTKPKYLESFSKIFSAYTIMFVSNAIFVAVSAYSILCVPILIGGMLCVLLVDRDIAYMSGISVYLLFLATFLLRALTDSFAGIIALTLSGIIITAVLLFTKASVNRLASLVAGLGVSLITPLVFMLVDLAAEQDFTSFFSNLGFLAIGCGGGVFLVLILQPLFEVTFNIITDARLVELTSPTNKLLTRLRTEAPGTYHHSLTVANLAEECAIAIGENPYMARAAACFHDVGKLEAPLYFKENQTDYNPHDELTPEASVAFISMHTTNGYEIAGEYRVPEAVRRITKEHHGSMPISYFYSKAQGMTENELNVEEYSYGGPLPTSIIAAIIMICDASEAAVRSANGADHKLIDKIVGKIINERLTMGQFDQCEITMNHLYKIRKALCTAFGALYHQRIAYPDQKASKQR